MSSSTSSSDAPGAETDALAWGRWLAAFLCALALGAAAIFALVLAVDPYDSGRFGILGIEGVYDESPRTANASRARDPQFDSALFGNSTGQLLKPSELSRLTGARFVQLTVPGTGPREQLAIMDFFLRYHARHTDAQRPRRIHHVRRQHARCSRGQKQQRQRTHRLLPAERMSQAHRRKQAHHGGGVEIRTCRFA